MYKHDMAHFTPFRTWIHGLASLASGIQPLGDSPVQDIGRAKKASASSRSVDADTDSFLMMPETRVTKIFLSRTEACVTIRVHVLYIYMYLRTMLHSKWAWLRLPINNRIEDEVARVIFWVRLRRTNVKLVVVSFISLVGVGVRL